jgi:Cellulose-binding Sde182, nucleoside hydrolase-like domain/Cellulose-binding protein Sde0182, C-terminal domain
MKSNSQDLLRNAGIFCIGLMICFMATHAKAQAPHQPVRPRIVVTTDPELDDNNSMIRFLLYSCDLDVEGLIYTSSGFHWKGDGKGTKWYVPGREYSRFGLDTCPCTSWRWPTNDPYIDNAVAAYAKVYPNLKVHDPDYPTPAYLKSKIRYGNIEFDGDISKDSPGSNLIKSLILDNKPGKLYITAWGGMSTIARALKSIQDEYEYTTEWEQIKAKISRKVVLLPSGDQDDMYAEYIKPNWPDIEYQQFTGGPNYSYGAQLHARPQDSIYMTAEWMKKNISDRGPLGALYRVWGDGKQMVKGDIMDYFGFSGYTDAELRKMGYKVWLPVQPKGSWLGEGDDPTFMNMPDNGLRAYQKGSYGGWGGRVVSKQTTNIFSGQVGDTSQQAMAAMLSNVNKQTDDYPDFFPAAQRDFAARLKWSVTTKYADANHPPLVRVEGPLHIMANPGEKIRLNAAVSDPDGDSVAIEWWQFRVGTYPNEVTILNSTSTQAEVLIPADAKPGETIHVILEGTDNGSPALTRYQRVIITIRGE